MNKNKSSNLLRLIAFFLTGVILVCTFGFTVDGWNQVVNDDNIQQPPQDNSESSAELPEEPKEEPPQVFFNKLTGVETTEYLSNMAPTAFVIEKKAPCFGLYGAEIIVDIPTEQSNRLLCIRTDNENLWKIGSIAPTRGYISNFASFFGSALLSYGSDEIIEQDSCTSRNVHDITTYCYSEYERYLYTNSELINPLLTENEFDAILPYDFVNPEDLLTLETRANRISFEECELKYSDEKKAYLWFENRDQVRDLANGKSIDFANCLILFADSVIYDNADGCQMVMNTIGSSEGYYASLGGITRIRWTSSLNGNMSFFNENGEPLIINRGNVYIRVLRSSTFNDFFVS